MIKKIVNCYLVLMFMAFAGSALAGNEGSYNTFYGTGAGASTSNTGTDYDTFIGSYAGYLNTGQYNSFIGYQAGYNNTGTGNNFIGYQAGASNTSGHNNSFIGYQAGYLNNTGYENNFIGAATGSQNISGYENNFIGNNAGYSNTTGAGNNFLGQGAGYSNTTGSHNNFIGGDAGQSNTTENYNTIIGEFANIDNTTPGSVTNATAIGAKAYVSQPNSLVLGSIANLNTATSSVNVGIGTSAPARQLHIVGSNAVFRMDRTSNTAAFMLVRTDTSGNPQQTFVVGTNYDSTNGGTFVINDLGTAVSGGGTTRLTIDNTGTVYVKSLVQTSSIANKDNIRTYDNALETVNKLRGVRFDWKDSGKPSVGLIAEEVEKVVPEVVAHDGGAATGVNYASLIGVLVEAVKEQQKTISDYQKLFDEQQKINAVLADKVSELEKMMKK